MKHQAHQVFASAIIPDTDELRLARSLEHQLTTLKMPNGTAAAPAVHTALMADLRNANAPSASLTTLSEEQIVIVCLELMWRLKDNAPPPLQLPFGSEAIFPVPGTLRIGAQHYVLDAGRPGLHLIETVARDAHGPNLERLIASIERKTSRLACRRLGAPQPFLLADRISPDVIQFAPLAEAGGVVLQRSAYETGADRFCAALPFQIDNLAKSIVSDMRALWTRRAEIGKRATEVRLAAEAGVQAIPDLEGRASVEAISIEFSVQGSGGISLNVHYRALDDALRPGTVGAFVRGGSELSGFLRVPRAIAPRTGIVERLAAVGATGWIEGIAEAVARAAPQGHAAVLACLATKHETLVVLPTRSGPLYGTLFWLDGVITAELSLPGRLEWFDDVLELQGVALPGTIAAALSGRPVSSLVELPFTTDAKIQEVEMASERSIRLRVEPFERLVNCSTGTIWDNKLLDRFEPGASSASG